MLRLFNKVVDVPPWRASRSPRLQDLSWHLKQIDFTWRGPRISSWTLWYRWWIFCELVAYKNVPNHHFSLSFSTDFVLAEFVQQRSRHHGSRWIILSQTRGYWKLLKHVCTRIYCAGLYAKCLSLKQEVSSNTFQRFQNWRFGFQQLNRRDALNILYNIYNL